MIRKKHNYGLESVIWFGCFVT